MASMFMLGYSTLPSRFPLISVWPHGCVRVFFLLLLSLSMFRWRNIHVKLAVSLEELLSGVVKEVDVSQAHSLSSSVGSVCLLCFLESLFHLRAFSYAPFDSPPHSPASSPVLVSADLSSVQ